MMWHSLPLRDAILPPRLPGLCICCVIIGFFALFTSTATSEIITFGSLSNGKFYTYDKAPASGYPDKWGNAWTDGVRLTDESYGGDFPWTNWVGWADPGTVEITMDLGRPSSVSQMRVHCASRITGGGIRFPAQVSFLTRETTNGGWVPWGGAINGPPDTAAFSTAWITGNGGTVVASQVKLLLAGVAGANLFVDEVDVTGWITNRWRGAPRWGCYHGSFPAESADGTNWFYSAAEFELQAGKMTAGNLYYSAMGATAFSKVGANYATNLASVGFLGRSYDGSRFQQVGMNPPNDGLGSSAADVASGVWDSYFTQFFTDYKDAGLRSGYANLIYLRLMNEFNGSWTAWSGDPDNYRIAFRRIYNIAQQLGVADRFVWVWSADSGGSSASKYSIPLYYPGDDYVDWVGLSLYPHSYFLGASNMPTAQINRIYPMYADRKPFMISEGGYQTNVNQVEWIYEWFGAIRTNFPMIKAFFWENHAAQSTGRRIDFSPATVAAYREACRDPYFLPTPEPWEKTFHGINASLANRDGWKRVSAADNHSDLWVAGDSLDQGLPAACVSGLVEGRSDVYALLPAEAGDDYALGGDLIDFASLPGGRSSSTRVYFESRVDENGGVLWNGWCVELARVYVNETNWHDEAIIRDTAGDVAGSASLGRISANRKVPFMFQRSGSLVHIILGDLSYSASAPYHPADTVVRMCHTVEGFGAPSGLFGVTGITLSSEHAKREDFAEINGPMPTGPDARWQVAATSADMPGNPALFTNFPATLVANDTNYDYLINPMPSGRVAGLTSGKMELYTTIPPQAGKKYRITGSLLDYMPAGAAVNRGMQTRVWIECDIDSAGQVRRRGWSFVLRKAYSPANPSGWYVRTEIRNPNDVVVLSSNKGQPSGIYPARFIFVRNGSNVTLALGTLIHSAQEDYAAVNNKVSLYCRPELDGGTENSNETGFYDLRIMYRTRPPAAAAPVLTILPGGTLIATGESNRIYQLQATSALAPSGWTHAAFLTNLYGSLAWTNEGVGDDKKFFRLKVID